MRKVVGVGAWLVAGSPSGGKPGLRGAWNYRSLFVSALLGLPTRLGIPLDKGWDDNQRMKKAGHVPSQPATDLFKNLRTERE